MKLRVIKQSEVAALLPMADCIELVAQALEAAAGGGAVQPLRTMMPVPGTSGILALMPGYLNNPEALGVKLISVYPDNFGTGVESHQGVIVLFQPGTGTPVALMDAGEVTAIRTAAASGVATRALARAEAPTLALLGYGAQARTHLDAMRAVRNITRVRVWGRSAERAGEFAQAESKRTGLPVEAAASVQAAVAGADIVCTLTASATPILEGRWLEDGMHINAVGAATPTTRELDTEAVARSRLYVDLKESAINQAGEFVIAKAEGRLRESDIVGEVGEVLAGLAPGREDAGQITLFKSLGVVVEDLVSALHVYDAAKARGIGVTVEI